MAHKSQLSTWGGPCQVSRNTKRCTAHWLTKVSAEWERTPVPYWHVQYMQRSKVTIGVKPDQARLAPFSMLNTYCRTANENHKHGI